MHAKGNCIWFTNSEVTWGVTSPMGQAGIYLVSTFPEGQNVHLGLFTIWIYYELHLFTSSTYDVFCHHCGASQVFEPLLILFMREFKITSEIV